MSFETPKPLNPCLSDFQVICEVEGTLQGWVPVYVVCPSAF
jgi:hypothetical protein